MTRQINVLDCQPDVLLLALPHIENKLAQESLKVFYGRQKNSHGACSNAVTPDHHAPVTNDGYVMHDRFIFEDSISLPVGTAGWLWNLWLDRCGQALNPSNRL